MKPPEGPPEPAEPGQDDWVVEFKRRVAEVEAAATEWGVRWQQPEGRFVAALLGAVAMLGGLSRAAQNSMEQIGREGRVAAEAELAQARQLATAARATLQQTQVAQVSLEVEREHVTARMIDATLPLFVERLQKVLVIREQRWNSDVRRRRFAVAGAVALVVFGGGYALRAWSDSGWIGAFHSCLAHAVASGDHLFCDVTSFAFEARWAGK